MARDSDQARLDLSVALAALANDPRAATVAELVELAAEAEIPIERAPKPDMIATLRAALGLDVVAGAPGGPAELDEVAPPPVPAAPPPAPPAAVSAPVTPVRVAGPALGATVVDIVDAVEVAPPPDARVRVAVAPGSVVGGVAVAGPPTASFRPPAPASWLYGLDTAAGAVIKRDGVAVAIGSTTPAPSRLPDGVRRPAPGPVPARPPAGVTAQGSAIAQSAAGGAPAPTGSELGPYAQNARDQIGTAILHLQQAVAKALPIGHVERGDVLRDLAGVAGRLNEITARILTIAAPGPGAPAAMP